ncbi:MAG TPA: glycosyltransferase [Acetobacteraceae bacterium]|nr:glycosyltransferase [Acetobacteraceae bacterium]
MRVAHVMAGAAEGGAELFYERLCIGQHRAGDAVLSVIRRNPERAETLRAAGLAPVELNFGPPVDFLTRTRLQRALGAFRPDVAVYWMNRANQHRVRGPWMSVGRLGGYYDLRYYRGCDRLVGNTRGIVAWLRTRGWPEDATRYLPNFVADFAQTTAADRAPLSLPDGDRLLLALGRLHRDKGFDTLIAALPRVPRATLAIAGSGPERAALVALAQREGVADRVRFLGWRTDVGALLKAADLFVSSSRIEPLGNMVLEAWSAARPIVAAAAAGPTELIRDGADGVIVPMENARALGDAIASLLDDPARAERIARAGRVRFETEFSELPVLMAWRDFLAECATLTLHRPTP